MMSIELITVLLTFAAVTLTLTGMILAGLRGMRAEMGKRFDGMEARLAKVEQGQAKLEGKLEGLLEALVFTRGVA